ncbi:MAG: c-type cytochrome [Rhodanobacter sp.]
MKRWLLRMLAALVLVVLVLGAIVWGRSSYLLHRTWQVTESALVLPVDATAIDRGHHLAVTRGCTDCHAQDMGGRVVMQQSPIGQMAAPNLTRGHGGVVAAFGVSDWERAIRHGLRPDGRALLLMPSDEMAALSDADTADLIVWLRQLPPVDRDTSPSFIGPLGRALLAFGKLPLIAAVRIDQHAAHVASITPVANASYGAYLVHGCIGCHGAHLSGGSIPGMPPQAPKAANLTPDVATGIGKWTKADFYRALRHGRKPDGTTLDPFMPWKTVGLSSDTELDALWAYLRSVPAKPAGQR